MAPVLADLLPRTVSALVLAAVAIAAVWLGGALFRIVIVVIGVGLTWEWIRLCRPSPSWPGSARQPTTLLPPSRGITRFAIGCLLIWLAIVAFWWLRADPAAGLGNTLFILGVVWATDIGAYMTGRTIGGPKLAPRISPGKTWAGAAGGLIAAACSGLGAAVIAATPFLPAAAVAAAFSAIGQAGDLAESAAKRRARVKDSGSLIPGHGGLLDRLDSTLAVSLAGALLAILRGRGVVLWG